MPRVAAEAEKLTDAYVKRKRAGEELPGRIRDRVAESLKVSASKLAMAQATREHLDLPGFKAQWEAGRIPDTVAYEISKMQGDHQFRLLDWLCDNHREASSLKVAEVRALEKQFGERPRKFDMSREKEDALFLNAAPLLFRHLRADFSLCSTRAEAIADLKKTCGGCHLSVGGENGFVDCDPSGVTVRNGKRGEAPTIRRTWAETFDVMALAAIAEKLNRKRGK